ncbi:ABC transporter ATP-binding protein [Melissococcus plutonius]|uniref:Teichoic acid export ATP-binding protein TagH n=2 Tax=Melissococcus plutonius TaxID=33970 RepID=F3Y9U7_MELPT|nr:ABC transporter ATP-binding protein [Melissococcus plutonius]BAL62349.1 teichoic acid export ATP-binding protein TagH [Melissococcus plutonius DAT561]AIM24807.1 teichoic acid export ATP-binding protein TagH [Melissococcus plutonius S1]KMT24924.1 teichoic acid export ATP-binding protein TagH [Melissococcus plutonius]KMT26561.1 teichoic acid export ATP-binding protein TagH [Melissococcus plutonius]KMT27811.1 teichoic acid export ATP-binding protein TagH [Melissococcus plutonius]
MSEYAIDLQNITKTYNMYKKPSDRFKEALNPTKKSYHDLFYALKKINIQIKKGEMIGFVGENGSGKSTLLKIITGVLTPSAGTMDIDGKISALLELGSGFNPEYSGYENIFLNGMVLGFSREEMAERVDSVIEFANIGDHLYQPVKTYSSGMFVRLAFAVAINVDPDILIVDEALAVGDLEFQLKCMEKFTEIKNSGKTILFVSHDINSIRRFCDRAFWLQNGKVVEFGDTMDVTTNYENYLKKKSIKTIDREKNSKDENKAPDIIDVTSAKLLNASLEPLEMVTQNEKVILKIEYTVKNDQIKSPVCGVAIRTVDNNYVCGLNTLLDKEMIPWKKGKNVFYLEYGKMSLLTGEYYFDIAFYEEHATVPLVYKTKYVNMFITGRYAGEGIVILDHKWKDMVNNEI